jgi:hypothetical protein
MGMVKIVNAGGWDFDGPISRIIKISNDGLRGNDRREFLKFASHAFLSSIEDFKIKKGEVPVHFIAVGAYEAYGLNRNGDGFDEQTCRDHHQSFEKFAKAFRSHKNKPHLGHPHYGVIKKSAYNDEMRRIELLVAYNGTKEAADRNGGLVADKELAKLAKDESLAGSMACSVAHDVCTCCGNQAKTRDDYCTASMCKAGGCKDNLTRLIKLGNDVHHLGVLNPKPHWFDWSLVWRPAERTAYGGSADYLLKTATDSDLFRLGGAKLAEDLGVTAPWDVIAAQGYGDLSTAVSEQLKLAYGLNTLEQVFSCADPVTINHYKLAFDDKLQSPISMTELDKPGSEKCARAIAALTSRKIVLPLSIYAEFVKKAELADAAKSVLNGVYGRMLADGSLEQRISSNKMIPSDSPASLQTRTWAHQLSPQLSLEKSAVSDRLSLATIRGYTVPKTGFEIKTASDNAAAEELARDYACYRLAVLHKIASFDDDFLLTARLSIVENQ